MATLAPRSPVLPSGRTPSRMGSRNGGAGRQALSRSGSLSLEGHAATPVQASQPYGSQVQSPAGGRIRLPRLSTPGLAPIPDKQAPRPSPLAGTSPGQEQQRRSLRAKGVLLGNPMPLRGENQKPDDLPHKPKIEPQAGQVVTAAVSETAVVKKDSTASATSPPSRTTKRWQTAAAKAKAWMRPQQSNGQQSPPQPRRKVERIASNPVRDTPVRRIRSDPAQVVKRLLSDQSPAIAVAPRVGTAGGGRRRLDKRASCPNLLGFLADPHAVVAEIPLRGWRQLIRTPLGGPDRHVGLIRLIYHEARTAHTRRGTYMARQTWPSSFPLKPKEVLLECCRDIRTAVARATKAYKAVQFMWEAGQLRAAQRNRVRATVKRIWPKVFALNAILGLWAKARAGENLWKRCLALIQDHDSCSSPASQPRSRHGSKSADSPLGPSFFMDPAVAIETLDALVETEGNLTRPRAGRSTPGSTAEDWTTAIVPAAVASPTRSTRSTRSRAGGYFSPM
eukprot:TRINITY_DN4282_c0_g1_i2.p1 TRINITY_DN4282_c0_g1~~TRINITY_DN4282_c0_g1_i2.p1  ORF type:complete len:506 (+),score=71.82 TRINITY_DN4282_c0_g1_i2:69-1586(+)